MDSNFDLAERAKKYGIPIVAIQPKDKLPSFPENGAYVINLQDDYDYMDNDLLGTHWVALWIEDKGAVYMDSFGFPAPANVEKFLTKRFKTYFKNTKQIQDISTGHCGSYSLLFLSTMMRNKNKSLEDRLEAFQHLFDTNTKKNLNLLKRYLRMK